MGRDYEGSFDKYQEELDKAGVEFNIRDLAGCTKNEIEDLVYSKTHFKCKQCNRITKKIKDSVGKASDWHCSTCKPMTEEEEIASLLG